MNKKQVEHLWLLAQKLRGGGIDSSMWRQTMIYALFLKYIQMVNEEYKLEEVCLQTYDDKFSLSYLALTYGVVVHASDLEHYINAVGNELSSDYRYIAQEMRMLLERANPEDVRVMFNELNQISFNTKSDIYMVAQWLLYKEMNSVGYKTGESYTNYSLSKLEACLLDCQEGMSVYDGYCGTGISAIEVAGDNGRLYLQDINIRSVAFATVMAILRGCKIGKIGCGDSQLRPLTDEMYDRIVCEPPFMPKYDKNYFIGIAWNNCMYMDCPEGETLAIRHVLAHLKSNGIATVLVPMGILFKSGRVGEIRERLIGDKYIDAVIELPAGVMPNTMIATALLVLRKDKHDNDIYVINAKDFFEKVDKNQLEIKDENIAKINKLYQNRETVEGVARNITVEEIAQNGFNLCTTQYVTLSPENTIELENTMVYEKKYEQLFEQLAEIDKQLGAVRSRFTKEA